MAGGEGEVGGLGSGIGDVVRFFRVDAVVGNVGVLGVPAGALPLLPKALLVAERVAVGGVTPVPVSDTDCGLAGASAGMVTVAGRAQIGRASGRERVEISVVAVSLKKKGLEGGSTVVCQMTEFYAGWWER